MNLVMQRLGRVPSLALLVAAGWSAVIIAGAFFVPVYDVEPAGVGPTTLVGVNGLRAVAVISVPLLLTLAVGCALWLRSRRAAPWRGALVLAWVLTGLLAVFNGLALLSIGIFVLPITVALIVACSASRPHRAGQADQPA